MSSSGFPSLEPAFEAHLVLGLPVRVGNVASGAPLTIVPFTGGTLKSLPGVEPVVNAKLLHGIDFSRADPSQKQVRLEINSVWENVDGAPLSFNYYAIMDLTPEVMAVMTADENATSTDFGNIFAHIKLETGSESLKAIEASHYIGSGRFILEKGQPLGVEYKISKVVK